MSIKLLKHPFIRLTALASLSTLMVGSSSNLLTTPVIEAAQVSTKQIKLNEKAAVKKFHQKYAQTKIEEI
ncbi:hypothetical protein LWHH1689_1733 [Limosilactobacillus reuteri]|uniref:Uncharacterized protein n=1 Tax=Limosilactobacillus reuteri TaxID=1598 RepID=A0A2S1EST6_LIMRT|nr:hypothetical protein [Limosilactobacillus reuteri]AWD63020.1 hypothetical protein LWHH1689_1733 [Limosilactobacillus reuteri]